MSTLLRELNIDVVVPPRNSQRTLTLGVKYSPDGICIPFKITLGNFIEALELGADTILNVGGSGICRLGRYAETQEQILRELGYPFEMVILGVSEKTFLGLLKMIKRISNDTPWFKIVSAFRFAMTKLYYLDDIEREVQRLRAVEWKRGTANGVYKEAIEAIDRAGDLSTLKHIRSEYVERLHSIPCNSDGFVMKVGLMGEFYVLLEPFSTLDIEVELGKLGVEVHRTMFLSEWTRFSLFLKPLGIEEKRKVRRAARPYLKRDVGGHGWESVGDTCLPEIIAQNIMPSTKDDIPVLTLICDEQMGKAGVLTRLEAFVDLLRYRRQKTLSLAARGV
jgi:predicted nucleotide-binding protein (sugar kinase/HSP70/actin superfamily)